MKQLLILFLLIMIPLYSIAKTPLEDFQTRKVDFILLNSDIAYTMHNQQMPELRSLFSLYPKMLTFITLKENNITTFSQIKEKNLRIAYDAKQLQSYKNLLGSFDLNFSFTYNTFKDASNALKKDKIDAFIALLGHPDQELQTLMANGDIKIVSLFGKKFDQLKTDTAYIIKGGIPAGMYGLEKDVKSIGVKYILASRHRVPIDYVYSIVSGVLTHIDTLKRSDPKLRAFTIKNILQGLCIPQHEGSIKAFNAR